MEALWRKPEKYKILQKHKMLHLLNLKNNNNDNKLILREIPSVFASKRVRVMKKHVLNSLLGAHVAYFAAKHNISLGRHILHKCRRLFVDLISFPSTKYSLQEFLDVEKNF